MRRKAFSLVFIFVLSLSFPASFLCATTTCPGVCSHKERKILEAFLKMGIKEQEYGYVLEGVKPISFKHFCGLSLFPTSKDIEREEREFDKTLLARLAIPVWDKVCSSQKKFVLKAVFLPSSQPITATLEVQFINVDKLNEVIESNIDLFRYVLGPAIQAKRLVDEIAYSDKPLHDVLQEDPVLIGIVLGFGSHNSLVGGRIEEIFVSAVSKDSPPLFPKSYLMEERDHSLSFFSPQSYGPDYLDFAGGSRDVFDKNPPFLSHPYLNFSNVKQEWIALNSLEEPLPSCLIKEFPRFVFGAFKGGHSNEALFGRLKETQKRIKALLKQPNFFQQVLEKIGGKYPLADADQKDCIYPLDLRNSLSAQQWSQVFLDVAGQFEEKEDQTAFTEAFLHPPKSSVAIPEMVGARRETLKGLKKALHNLEMANAQFETFSRDASLQTVVPGKLYFKTTHSGLGTELKKENRVRVSYVMKDLEGEILFANYDTWVCLSETIPGFSHGLQGMKLGEKRTLFIHPTLGYGALTTLPPCIGLAVTVHLIDIEEHSQGPLAPLRFLDVDWIKNPAFCRAIEESIKKRPHFVGAFYREMLDGVANLDKSTLITDMNTTAFGSAQAQKAFERE